MFLRCKVSQFTPILRKNSLKIHIFYLKNMTVCIIVTIHNKNAYDWLQFF